MCVGGGNLLVHLSVKIMSSLENLFLSRVLISFKQSDRFDQYFKE